MIAWNAPEPEPGEPARVGPVDLMVLILFPWIEPPAEITSWDCGPRSQPSPEAGQ